VLRGFTSKGDPIVNDPAAWANNGVRRVYDRAQFERAWLRGSEGTVYVIHPSDVPLAPLPELLFEDEVQRVEEAARTDVRCHLLVLLLLATGLKKEEIMGLRLQHVDVSDPEHPAIEVHFPGQAKRRRERRMPLPAEWSEIYGRYLARYRPQEHVLECTVRNLN